MVRPLAPVNRRTVAVVASLATCTAATAAWPLRPAGTPAPVQPLLIAVAWVTFALAAWLVLRLDQRRAVPLIIAGAIVLPVVAGLGPPRSSDDLYRYMWDGRVQAAGIDPYRFAPAAPDLVGLRDDELWPARSAWCVPAGAVDEATGEPLTPGCTLINRPWVHTIYPPAAQWIFRAVVAASPTRAPAPSRSLTRSMCRSMCRCRSPPACSRSRPPCCSSSASGGGARIQDGRRCGPGARWSRSRPAATLTSMWRRPGSPRPGCSSWPRRPRRGRPASRRPAERCSAWPSRRR